MEPRSLDRGNTGHSLKTVDDWIRLQWSRGLSTAETPSIPIVHPARPDASMEPRSLDRGNTGTRSTRWSLD